VRITSGPRAGSVAVTHLPNLDSGGKCRPGVKLLCRRQPGVFADTVGQYGTPKCELICQLLRCEEAENAVADIALGIAGGGVWVSAHPKLNEKLVEALLSRGAFDDRLHAAVGRAPSSDSATCPSDKNDPDDDPCRSPVKTQVTMRREATTSVSGGYRPDFVVSHADGASTVLETKQVVDTDYDARTAAEAAEAQAGHPVFLGGGGGDEEGEYTRAGIFPWGKRNQKGPDGELVVSARAIEHLRELSSIARGKGNNAFNSDGNVTHAAVILLAGRHDVGGIRANGAACESFARYASRASNDGVRILAHKIRWGDGDDVGKAFDAGPLPMMAPTTEGRVLVVEKPKAAKKPKKEKKATAAKQAK